MTTTNTRPEPASTDVVDEACEMFLEWDGNVYSSMNMTEGLILSDLLASLGREKVAEHIARSVWEADNDSDVDPLPWANGHGSRKTDQTVTYEDRFEREGMERFRFIPRVNLEDLPDVAEFWAALDAEGAA